MSGNLNEASVKFQEKQIFPIFFSTFNFLTILLQVIMSMKYD